MREELLSKQPVLEPSHMFQAEVAFSQSTRTITLKLKQELYL